MSGDMEHFDKKVMEHFDDRGYGTLRCHRSWNIVMISACSIVMTGVMEHCDDRGEGVL